MADSRRDRTLPVPMLELVDQRAPAHVRELWLELGRRRVQRRGNRLMRARRWLALAACFALLLGSTWALSAGLRPSSGDGRALLMAQGSALPANMQTEQPYQAFDLSDGSRITVLRGARLDVLETSARSVGLALRSGRVRFDVRPRGPRAWRIDCGGFSVEVVGTKFVLERSSLGLRVDVLHGAVLVRGEGIPDGVQRLNAGQSLRVQVPALQVASATPGARRAKAVLLPPTTLVAERGAEVTSDSAQETEPVLAPRRHPHRHPARRPRPAAHADTTGHSVDNVDALFRAADRARLEGRLDDAVIALRRILESHADDSRAALAGFALGRLQLTALRRPEQAARQFRLALSLGLPSALSEDAYAKLVEAHVQAGNQAAACSAFQEYSRRYPQGAKRAVAPAGCELSSAR